MQAKRILETCLCVDDLRAAEEFFCRVLGLVVYSRVEGRHVFFQCGAGMFLLFNAKQTAKADGAMPTHGTLGPGHAAFAAEVSEIPAWRAQLLQEGVKIESEIDWPNGGHSIYFRDPAGSGPTPAALPRARREASSRLATVSSWRPLGSGACSDYAWKGSGIRWAAGRWTGRYAWIGAAQPRAGDSYGASWPARSQGLMD